MNNTSQKASKDDKRRRARVQGSFNSGPPLPAGKRAGQKPPATSAAAASPSTAAPAAAAAERQQQPITDSKPPAAAAAQFVFDASVQQDLAREAELASKPVQLDTDGEYVLSTGADGADAVVFLKRSFLNEEQTRQTMSELMRLPWQVRTGLDRAGHEYMEPRKTCWYGRPYTYSHVKWDATDTDAWPPVLTKLKIQLADILGVEFNSVMCNLYRDGKDLIGWHADDEASLGRYPVIASLSFGETRRFLLRRRDNRLQSLRPRLGDPVTVPLSAGDLLVMRGSVQDDWLHSVPSEYHDKQARVNLTFRVIRYSPSEHLNLHAQDDRCVELSLRPGEMSAQLCCYRSPLSSDQESTEQSSSAGSRLLDEAARALSNLQWSKAGPCDIAQLDLLAAEEPVPPEPLARLARDLAGVTGNANLGVGPYARLVAVRLDHGTSHLPWRDSAAAAVTGGDSSALDGGDFVTVLALGGDAVSERPLDVEKRLDSPARGHLKSARVIMRHGDAVTMRHGFCADWRYQLGRAGAEPHPTVVFVFLAPAGRGIDRLLAGLSIA